MDIKRSANCVFALVLVLFVVMAASRRRPAGNRTAYERNPDLQNILLAEYESSSGYRNTGQTVVREQSDNVRTTYPVDDIKYPANDSGLHQAVRDAMAAGGGRVLVVSSMTLTSRLDLGNSTSKPPIILEIGPAANLSVNISGGSDAILEYDNACIVGSYGIAPFKASLFGSRITLLSTASIGYLVRPGAMDGKQQGFCLSGLQIFAQNGARADSMVFVKNVFSGTHVEDVTILNFPAIGLEETCDSAGGSNPGSTVHYYSNVVVGGGPFTGARPVVLYNPGGCVLSQVDFHSLDAEHPGTSAKGVVEITGPDIANSSVVTANAINFFGGYLEGSNAGDVGFRIFNAHHVLVVGVSASTRTATASGDFIQINATHGTNAGGIVIVEAFPHNWRRCLNNVISGQQVSGGADDCSIGFYEYQNPAAGTYQSWFDAVGFRSKISIGGGNALTGQTGSGANIVTNVYPTISGGVIAGGSTATLSGTGACATTRSRLGGSWSGQFACTGMTGASTVTITPGGTAPHGWSCSISDVTAGVSGAQSGVSATSCTVKFSSVTANDVLVFSANAY